MTSATLTERHVEFVVLNCLAVPWDEVSIPALFRRDHKHVMQGRMDNKKTHDQTERSTDESNLHVVDVMQRAEQELRHLMKERAEISKRIGIIKRTILGLAKLFGNSVLGTIPAKFVDRGSGLRQPGLTRVCRRVLREAQRPLSARDVCDEIQRTAPPLLAHHKEPLSTINTILARLVEYGEAAVSKGDHGQRTWMWVAEQGSEPDLMPDHHGNGSIA